MAVTPYEWTRWLDDLAAARAIPDVDDILRYHALYSLAEYGATPAGPLEVRWLDAQEAAALGHAVPPDGGLAVVAVEVDWPSELEWRALDPEIWPEPRGDQ
jgi:hypothetical protein